MRSQAEDDSPASAYLDLTFATLKSAA